MTSLCSSYIGVREVCYVYPIQSLILQSVYIEDTKKDKEGLGLGKIAYC